MHNAVRVSERVKRSADINIVMVKKTCNKQVARKKYANDVLVCARAYQLFYCRNYEIKLIKNPLRQFFALWDKKAERISVVMQQVESSRGWTFVQHRKAF